MEKYELWESGRGKKIKRLFIRSDHNGDRLRKKLTKSAKITYLIDLHSEQIDKV